MNEQPVIRAEGLWLDYKFGAGWINALQDISLAIHEGEIHGLVGESGSGKSTLALALMRYLAPNARITRGRIEFDGQDLLAKTDAEMRGLWGKAMSLVPQDALASLNPSYPVGDQIAEVFIRHAGLGRREAWARSVEMLSKVKIADPDRVAARYPHQLSGGMQQRVTIAMALSARPRLLVLDEPTTSLDVTTQAVVIDLVRDLIREEGAAALYVSHDLGLIAQLCDYVTVLYGGEIMASAPVRDLYHRPLHPYTISLLASLPRPTSGAETRLHTIEGVAPSLAERPAGCVFADRCHAAVALCHTEKPPLETVSDGRLIKCHRWREIADGSLVIETTAISATADAPPREGYVLQARNVRKVFGARGIIDRLLGRAGEAVRALDGVSVKIRARSTLGLVGESGSGKTTLARCIVGLEAATEGEIELLDMPLALSLRERPRKALRDLQMVFQNPNDALNPYRTVGDALARAIRRLEGNSATDAEIDRRVHDLLSAVRLTPEYAARYPAELSGGEKQRVAIARAFAANPALVVADEPTSALDVSVQSVILNLLKDLRAQHGASYLFISHDLKAVAYLADWIAVMYLGEIVEFGDAEDVYNAPSHPYTEALISAIPEPDPDARGKQIRLEGDIPSPRHKPSGCPFHTRCPRKIGAICETTLPPWQDAGDGHQIRCHIPPEELIVLQATLPSRTKETAE